ncbi:FMN-linked oxidoreductase [Fomitopsis serialis]|uniref:FMN-linked oxidoreductase n=1 Tax=Fomitopsis serialis TaxID=139415 RepID=UPI0020079330|nr:FMN-linked oxidoreductase [Neoantrodia serialis]KAH9920271.1 FMN-linked oxidoreductase [Neoantrodia serialis]
MVRLGTIVVDPPVLNSSCLWASDIAQLRDLYACPHTGAVTIRTATLHGFKENESNAVVFTADRLSTLNSYGYSPYPLSQYLEWVRELLTSPPPAGGSQSHAKPVILSITASKADDLAQMQVSLIYPLDLANLIAIELNTSCPNIPSAPPPCYHLPALRPHLDVLAAAARADPSLTIGLKLSPYPDVTRIRDVVDCLAEYTIAEPGSESEDARSPFAFLTCTNTLGGSVLFAGEIDAASAPPSLGADPAPTAFALPTPLGGIGGERLHALALGTVLGFSRALAAHPTPAMRAIKVIGVGGVKDRASADRMRAAGASAVACATALGREGLKAFERIAMDA